jgi:hypothetical protein
MASLDRLRAIRRLEYLVFGGVPESPEPMFERDGNPQAEGRITGRAIGGGHHRIIGVEPRGDFLEFDPETGVVSELQGDPSKEDMS